MVKSGLNNLVSHAGRMLVLLVLASAFSIPAFSDPEVGPAHDAELVFRVYPLNRAPEPEWVELLREAAGAKAYIIAGQRAEIYVRATLDDHAVIAEMLKALDRPARNIRIVVRFLDDAREQQRHIGVDAAGEFRWGDRNSGRIQLQPRITHSDTKLSGRTEQTLLTLDGGSASLFVGEEIPYAPWIIRRGRQWGYFEPQVQVQPVGAFLAVEPRILGDGPMIRVRLTPELSYRTGVEDPRSIRFTRLSTEVTVRDGQAIDLGGLAEESDFYRRFLTGRDRSGRTRRQQIQLTPSIE